AVLAGCPVGGGGEAATIDPDWGEPGLTAAEKIYGWNSFIVLAMLSGRPENPVNAVAPNARARCHIRYTVDTDPAGFEAALRRNLDEQGFQHVQVIPNASGGLPGDVFVDHLGVPLVWVPHSYNGCKQHGPDEHLLASVA